MTFTSLTFLIFVMVVLAAYWSLAGVRAQNWLLLAASYFFYGWWDWRFCFLILGSSLFDYVIASRLDRELECGKRRRLLAASVIANLGLLGVFKYFHFFTDSFRHLAMQFGWDVGETTISIVLPVGISFYTFQTLGYTIDVYRRKLQASRNLVDYLTFVSFFPQLVAGPIERATALLPQFAGRRTFDYHLATSGCRLILWGIAKKLIVADRLALIVNDCYASPDSYRGPMLALATLMFAFQIYCDFSAYSEIAIGTSRLLGIRLMRNFAYPYFSQNISEFWRRWHISLSTWFRDYVYIPLGGNRRGKFRHQVNLIVTFLVSGLWHGAAWHFVLWGGVNGIATAGSRAKSQAGCSIPGGDRDLIRPVTLLRIGATLALVCFGWVFFRATSLSMAVSILSVIFADAFSSAAYRDLVTRICDDTQLANALACLIGFVCWEWLGRSEECPLEGSRAGRPVRWACYSLLIWGTLYAVPNSGGREFIYFAF